MTTRTRAGRRQVDRAGIAAMTGVAASTVAGWARRRAPTGFPVAAAVDGRREWYWRDEIIEFRHSYQHRRGDTFTTVNRRGHPGDLLTAPEAARVLGYRDHRSLTRALREHPDRVRRLPSGRLRRFWYRRTLWSFADSRGWRTSTGRPPGTTGARLPHRYAGDPRLAAAAGLLAEAAAGGATSHASAACSPPGFVCDHAPPSACSPPPARSRRPLVPAWQGTTAALVRLWPPPATVEGDRGIV